MKLTMKKEKFSGLDGRTYVRWTEESSTEPRAFQVEASPSGIRFKGTMAGEIEDGEELQVFAKLLSDVWVEHHKLRQALLGDALGPRR